MRPLARRCPVPVMISLLLATTAWTGTVTTSPAAAQERRDAGTVRFVSPTGSDKARGTKSAPFRTIEHALERLRPADTLMVRGGTYTENITSVSLRAGTRSARVTVRNYPGERPVLRGLLWLKNPSYWVIDGLNVTWNRRNDSNQHMVKLTGGTGWRLTRGELWGARSYAALLVAGTPSRYRIDRMYLHDTHRSNDSNQDHLLYINGGIGGGVVERSIFAHSSNGRGIKIGPPSGSSERIGRVEIRYNTFVDNTGPSNIQLSYGATGNRIHHNLFWKSGSHAVTAYNLNGKANSAHDNLAWKCRGVVETGIRNLGGNRLQPFSLTPSFRPRTKLAVKFGRFAH